MAQQITAQRTHAAAVQMVASLERAEQCSAGELAARSGSTSAADKAVRDVQAELAAAECERTEEEHLDALHRLRRYVADELNTPLNQFGASRFHRGCGVRTSAVGAWKARCETTSTRR